MHILNTTIIALAAAGLVGCANVTTKPSGFLGSYERMEPTKPGGKTMAYHDAKIAEQYHAVIVEGVCFQTNAAAKLSAKQQAKLGESLTERARRVFGTKYAIVTEPQPGVLRLRMTVNDINKSSTVINLVTTAAVFFPLDMGAVSVEMEAVDSVSGEQVAALLAQQQGWPLTPAGFFGSFASTGHAQTGFSSLSREMLKVLGETKESPVPNTSAADRMTHMEDGRIDHTETSQDKITQRN